MTRTVSIFVVLFGVLVSGCQYINPNDSHPVLSKTWGPNKANDVGEAIAIKAERRIVIVMFKPAQGSWARFCSEPSPDISQNLTNALTAVLQASLTKNEPGNIQIANQIATTAKDIHRSLGIQWARDQLFGLCQLYANEAIKPDIADLIFRDILTQSANIILEEVKRQPITASQPKSTKK